MGKPNGQRRMQINQGSTGNRKISKKTKINNGNSIGKFVTSQTVDHSLKLGVNIFDQLNVGDKQNKEKSAKQTLDSKSIRPPPVILTGKANDINKVNNILKENGIDKST